MYAPHQGAEGVRATFTAPRPKYSRNGQPATMRGLMGSASRKDKQLLLTVTNPDPHETQTTEIALAGARASSAPVHCTTLADQDVHAVNSFEEPERIHPRQTTLPMTGASLVYPFPPASVTGLEITLD